MGARAALLTLGVACGLGVSAMAPREAQAQDRFNTRQGRVTNGLFYRSTVALRLNPLGLFGEVRAGYRRRLFDTPGASILLKNTYIAAGVSMVASPAFARPGVFVEFQPLAILQFQAVFERVWWFGNFQFFQSWPTVVGPRQSNGQADGPNSYSDNQLNLNRDAPDSDPRSNYSTTGYNLTLGGLLQAKVGDLAIRSNFRGVRYFMDTRTSPGQSQPDRVSYDPFYDTLVPAHGWLFLNDTDLIYQMSDLGVNIGARLSTVIPLYDGVDYAAGEAQENDNTTMRLGPIVSYTFREQRHRAFNAPTVFVLTQWWLRHPYRTGLETSQGVPMFVAGFSFRGDS
ncbi:MAG: hypothetical protein JNK72_00980 [Myxococcales bacterium]|nr:hypothetical protein [Myxococcales bacterium]